LPSLRNGFAFDDVPIVEANPVVHGLSAFPSTILSPYWGQYGQLYRPVTQLALSIDWSLGGGSPWVFHLTNVLLNALVAALVARLALRWLTPVGAAAAALTFAVHPIHVEAVANVVGRSELLCAAALLGVMLLATSERLPDSRRYLGIALFSALAVGSKEIGVLAPLAAWAAALASRSRTPIPAGEAPAADNTSPAGPRRRAGLAGLAAACGVVPLLLARLAILGALTGDRPHPVFSVATPSQTYQLALASTSKVFGLLLAPQQPRIDYSPTLTGLAHPPAVLVVLGAFLVGAAVAVVIAHAKRPGLVTFALVLTAVTFAPVSNLAFRSGLIIAERTLYSPSIGIALLMGLAVQAVWQSPHRWAVVFGGLWVGPALWLSVREIPIWASSERVYETMRVRAPDSYKAHFLVGNLRVNAGRMTEATDEFATAVRLFDGDPQILYGAGAHAMRMGDTTRAIEWLAKSVRLDAKNRRARGSMVRLLLATGDSAEARRLLDDGLAREPDLRVWKALRDSL